MNVRRFALWSLFWLAAVNCRAPLVATGPLLPLIRRDLHLSATVGGTLTAIPLLVMALLSIPGGLVVDRFGPRAAMIAGQLAIAFAGGIRGLVPHPTVYLVAVALLGGAIGISQPALARLSNAMAPTPASVATSIYANGFVMGGLFASLLSATAFLQWVGPYSWRGVLALWAILGLAVGVGWILMRPSSATRPARASRAPAGWWTALTLPGVLPIGLVFASQSAIFYGLVTWIPSYYVGLGWSVGAASWPNTILSLASIPGALITPSLIQRWGNRITAIFFGTVTLAGVLGFWLLPALGVLWAIFPGIGTAGGLTLGLAAAPDLAPPDRVGVVAGVLLAIGYLGAVPGALVVGNLRDLTGSFAWGLAYLAAIGLVFVGAGRAIPDRGAGVASA